MNVDRSPARVREVHGTGGELRLGRIQPHPLRERLRVGDAHRVRDVEEQVARHLERLARAPLVVERLHQIEELHRHRARAHQNVALATDVDTPPLGPLTAIREVSGNQFLRVFEERTKRLGSVHGLRHRLTLADQLPKAPFACTKAGRSGRARRNRPRAVVRIPAGKSEKPRPRGRGFLVTRTGFEPVYPL